MSLLTRFLFGFSLISIFAGCSSLDSKDQLPTFIEIKTYRLANSNGQTIEGDGISELWVYANGDIVGIYDTIARIPVLEEGSTDITVFAGIKNNAMGMNRIRYPFYNAFDTTLTLVPGETIEIKPEFSYVSLAAMDESRDFESGNYFEQGTANEGALTVINDPAVAIQGNRCGKATLNSSQSHMEFVDGNHLALTAGNTAFLEMNYSCNNTFSVGLYAVYDGVPRKQPILYLVPTTSNSGDAPEWNKVFIDLGMMASQNVYADYFMIYVESDKLESTTPTVYLDNLKIVNW
jgi:hypothetical protein